MSCSTSKRCRSNRYPERRVKVTLDSQLRILSHPTSLSVLGLNLPCSREDRRLPSICRCVRLVLKCLLQRRPGTVPSSCLFVPRWVSRSHEFHRSHSVSELHLFDLKSLLWFMVGNCKSVLQYTRRMETGGVKRTLDLDSNKKRTGESSDTYTKCGL